MSFFRLKGEFISTDGKGVDYKKIKNSPLYIEYRDEMAPQLQYVVLDNIPEEEKKAFFISILCWLHIKSTHSYTMTPFDAPGKQAF